MLANKFPSQTKVTGIIVTTNKTLDDENASYDIVSRYFAPWKGINEDPVTGSAHTVLAAYWAPRLKQTTIVARQASSRGGTLWLSVHCMFFFVSCCDYLGVFVCAF
jgi:predicted PhzF superfamily epimerase YddE/YHI9